MRRSGSTLQYQIAADLVETLCAGRALGWVDPEQFENARARWEPTSDLLVLKTHRYIHAARDLAAQGEAIAIYSYRDIRDVVVSMMNKADEPFWRLIRRRFVQTAMDDDRDWTALPRVLVARYETAVHDISSEIARIAAHLGLTPGSEMVDDLARRYSLDAQRVRIESFDYDTRGVGQATYVHDPASLLHRNHIRSGQVGQWRDSLSPAQIAIVENIACDWLRARGYHLSQPFINRKASAVGFLLGRFTARLQYAAR